MTNVLNRLDQFVDPSKPMTFAVDNKYINMSGGSGGGSGQIKITPQQRTRQDIIDAYNYRYARLLEMARK